MTSEPRMWGLTRFERIMALLTLAGVAIAVFTGLIFWWQLDEMKTDQRAWITLSASSASFPKDVSMVDKVPVVLPLTLNNTGKTAARLIEGAFVMDYEVNGQSPDFVYENRARTFFSTGILFPNSPQTIPVNFMRGKLNDTQQTEPRYLTASEYQDLTNGNGYMVVYAQTTFMDIFGKKHWMHYCIFFVAPNAAVTVTAHDCTNYNDTDNN